MPRFLAKSNRKFVNRVKKFGENPPNLNLESMVSFDVSEWSRHRLAYLIILVIVIIVLLHVRQQQKLETRGDGIHGRKGADGNGTSTYYGRGSHEDSIKELFDRIDWASYLPKRITLWYKVVIMSLVISIFVMLLVNRKLLAPSKLITLFVVVFIPIYAMSQFYYVHGEIYNDYYIKHNVDLLRLKLHLGADHPPTPRSAIPPHRTSVMHP